MLRDEHIEELEDVVRETRMVWDIIGIRKVRRREECLTTTLAVWHSIVGGRFYESVSLPYKSAIY